MSESRLGVSVAAMRQNSGRSPYGANAPAATTSACVTFASFKAAAARLSHVAATDGAAPNAIRNASANALLMTRHYTNSVDPVRHIHEAGGHAPRRRRCSVWDTRGIGATTTVGT